MGRPSNRALALLLGVVLAGAAVATVDAASGVADPLDLRAVRVLDAPGVTAPTAERLVAIEFEVLDEPVCADAQTWEFGVFVDADRDAATGETELSGFEDMGVEAALRARCDPGTDLLVSEAGEVAVVPTADGAIVRILVAVGDLPALTFDWAAYAIDLDDGTAVRSPTGHVVRFDVLEVARDDAAGGR